MPASPSLAEIPGFVDTLERQTGLDYGRFLPEFLADRLGKHLAAERLASLAELERQLAADRLAQARLQLALSIRPAGLFPDAGLVKLLREEVCPRLRTYPSIRIWHAGCSTGEDVYATAIVLREEGLLSRTLIYATDLSEVVLARARLGRTSGTLRGAEERYRASGGTAGLLEYYQLQGDQLVARPLLRDPIVFAEHALGSDGSFNEFHLIVCRDLLAQMRPSFQEQAQDVIRESLCMFGFLFLGEHDAPGQGALRSAVIPLGQDRSFYRRVR